jgi:hypothetical protein
MKKEETSRTFCTLPFSLPHGPTLLKGKEQNLADPQFIFVYY